MSAELYKHFFHADWHQNEPVIANMLIAQALTCSVSHEHDLKDMCGPDF